MKKTSKVFTKRIQTAIRSISEENLTKFDTGNIKPVSEVGAVYRIHGTPLRSEDKDFIENSLVISSVYSELFTRLGKAQIVELNMHLKTLLSMERQIEENLSQIQRINRKLDNRWFIRTKLAFTVEDCVAQIYERLTRLEIDSPAGASSVIASIDKILSNL